MLREFSGNNAILDELNRKLSVDLFNRDSLAPRLPGLVVVEHWLGSGLLNKGGIGDDGADDVGVHVGGGSSVLDVALAVCVGGRGGDSEGGSSVGDTVGEGVAGGGLVVPSQSLVIVVTVDGDVQLVFGAKAHHHVIDVLEAELAISHGLGGEVGVAAGTVPVGEELGGEGNVDVVVLSDTVEEVAGNVDLVTDCDTFNGSDLVLPLTGHNLGVGAGDLDTSVEAGLVVSVGDGTTEGDVGTSGAVVGTLSTGVAIVGPAEGLFGELGAGVKESVLLLNTVPGLLLLDGGLVPDLFSEVSEVGVARNELLAGLVLPVEGLAHDEDVVALSEGVGIESDWFQDDLGLFGGGLVG